MPQFLRVLPAFQHEQLADLLTANGWQQVDTDANLDGVSEVPVDSSWRHPEFEAIVSWFDDQDLSEHYFGLVFGPAAASAVKRLEKDAALISAARGIEAIAHAQTVEHVCRAAHGLGLLAAGPFDSEVFEVLSGMLESGNVDIQFAALTGVMFSAWPQFEPVVERLASNEATDEEVQAEAIEVLELQRESNWNEELR